MSGTSSRFAVMRRVVAAAILLSLAPSWSASAQPPSPAAADRAIEAFDGSWERIGSRQLLAPVGGGLPPFTKAGRASYRSNMRSIAKKDFTFDLTTARCSSPGLPRVMLAPGPMRLYVRPDIVLMRFQWNRIFRQVSMGKERVPQSPDSPIAFNRGAEELLIGTMMGKSYGRWEKDALVVTSGGFSDRKLLDNALPGSEELKLTERFRLIDADTLEDKIRIEDPVNYTRPWEVVLTYRRVANQPFPEHVCFDQKWAGEMVWPH